MVEKYPLVQNNIATENGDQNNIAMENALSSLMSFPPFKPSIYRGFPAQPCSITKILPNFTTGVWNIS